MTDPPVLVKSPRERHPERVPAARTLAADLTRRGRHVEAGWLLLGLVAAELVRRPPVAPEAVALANQAAAAFLRGDAEPLADDVAAAAREGHLGTRRDPAGRRVPGLITPEATTAGVLGALDALDGPLDPTALLGWYASLGLAVEGARVAERRKRFLDAARLWGSAQRPLDAARAFVGAGDDRAAIDAILTLPQGHRLYRASCVALATLCARTRRLDFAVDHFLGAFLAEPPRDGKESDAFALLADLYRESGRPA
jgi:hypothetical protein